MREPFEPYEAFKNKYPEINDAYFVAAEQSSFMRIEDRIERVRGFIGTVRDALGRIEDGEDLQTILVMKDSLSRISHQQEYRTFWKKQERFFDWVRTKKNDLASRSDEPAP